MACHLFYLVAEFGFELKVTSVVVEICLKLIELPTFHTFEFSSDDLSLNKEDGSPTIQGLIKSKERISIVLKDEAS